MAYVSDSITQISIRRSHDGDSHIENLAYSQVQVGLIAALQDFAEKNDSTIDEIVETLQESSDTTLQALGNYISVMSTKATAILNAGIAISNLMYGSLLTVNTATTAALMQEA